MANEKLPVSGGSTEFEPSAEAGNFLLKPLSQTPKSALLNYTQYSITVMLEMQ